jgi:hypothetical protein
MTIILLCKEYNCIFITFSRCWSKTMIEFIKDLYKLDKNVNHSTIVNYNHICLNKSSIETLKKIKDDYNIYFMVRNPYERFISNIGSHAQFSDKSFIETINYYKENKYTQDTFYNEQTKILLSGKNVRIIKFDNLKNELNDIFLKHNIPIKLRGKKEYTWDKTIDLKSKNKNIYEQKLNIFKSYKMFNYKYFYNQEIIDFVYNKFKNDFTYFGFEKNIDNLVPNDNMV